jgi:hypothetical protein
MGRNKGPVKAQRKRSDRERLELFIKKFEELQSTELARKGFRVQHRVRYSPGSVEYDLIQPDESDLREYLLTFRPFISENEDVFLNRIFNICHQRLTSDEMKQSLAQARQSFERGKQDNGIHFLLNGRQFTPLQITNMYLDGRYFHNDLEYQQQLDSMLPLIEGFPRTYFLSFIMHTTKIIVDVYCTVGNALEAGLFQFEEA